MPNQTFTPTDQTIPPCQSTQRLADRTAVAFFTLVFLLGILGITSLVIYRYLIFGDPAALEEIKTT